MNASKSEDSLSQGEHDTVAPSQERSKWDDPTVPVGDAPPMPRWPIALFATAWVAWIAFLVAMMLSRGAAGVT